MRPEIPSEVFLLPLESSPSTAPNDPQTSRVAQKHSHVATLFPKPLIQIPAPLRPRLEEGSCGPLQTTLYPVGKCSPFASHSAARMLRLTAWRFLHSAFSSSTARSHIPLQIPASRKSASPAAWHLASSCERLPHRDAR